jgi:predicted RNA-binding Zn-ribbon protein involved in translation (DUF1610 family)
MKTECPRCGTALIKEKIDSRQNMRGSHDTRSYEGSVDYVPISTYVYTCPKCGYLSIDC